MTTKKFTPHYCTFCNKECREGIDQMSKTKRKTEVWWHDECYDRYKVLLAKDVDDWTGGQG